MRMRNRKSNVEGRTPQALRRQSGFRPSTFDLRRQSAFTLIEIMIAVGIIAIIFTMALPHFAQNLKKDPMRQAITDLTEACSAARNRAILNGVATELRIRPVDRSINVVESTANASASFGKSTYSFEGEEFVEHKAGGGGGGVFNAKISEHVVIEFIGVNLIPDLQQLEEVSCMFYPNGTSDELVVLLRSDQGEVRKVTTEVVTGIADVEFIK